MQSLRGTRNRSTVEPEPKNPVKPKRKPVKRYTIKYNGSAWFIYRLCKDHPWRVCNKYATEKQRDEALKTLNKKRHKKWEGEYRKGPDL